MSTVRTVRCGAPAAFLALLLAACSGTVPAAQPSPEDVREPAARTADERRAAPVVRMQAGTDVAKGLVLLSCVGARCTERDPASPRYIQLAGRGMVLFTSGEVLREPQLEVRRSGGNRVVEAERLRDGSTIAYPAGGLRRGRYRLTLEASWEGGRGGWLFGLRVPASLA